MHTDKTDPDWVAHTPSLAWLWEGTHTMNFLSCPVVTNMCLVGCEAIDSTRCTP